jgi:hypothetical protein
MKPTIRESLQRVTKEIEANLDCDPFAILNEYELQALLHHGLLAQFPQTPELTLAADVINPRLNTPYTSRRVYRELKISPGKTGKGADLVVLTNGPQVLHAKENKAPSIFARPYSAIIEVKMDMSRENILNGVQSRPKISQVLKDLEKWSSYEDETEILSVVYTDRPESYEFDDRIHTISRSLKSLQEKPQLPSISSVQAAVAAYPEVLRILRSDFIEQPYWFLREKDFETALFFGVRDRIAKRDIAMNPVRTQFSSPHEDILGNRRRHDFVIRDDSSDGLALEIELKTSHSMHHNWFRKADVISEFDKMQQLRNAGKLDRAIFTLFRIGAERWREDADKLQQQFSMVEIDYICSEDQ